MSWNTKADFVWRADVETLESLIRGQQRDALMFWMLQHHDDMLSTQTVQHIHDLIGPIEWANAPRSKYTATDCIEAANMLRRGSNAAVCHQMHALVDLCTRYIQLLEQRPVPPTLL